MDILIFIAIFSVLPRILKKINENNKNKSGFNFDDIDLIKRELAKLKTSAEAKVKETNPKSKVAQTKMEKMPKDKMVNPTQVNSNQISEFHKKEAAVYNLDTNYVKQSNKKEVEKDEKIKLGLNDKNELRRAIVMSEVLGKPRALKKFL